MGITAVHVVDESYLLLCMLVWVGMGSPGFRFEGFGCAVIALAETVDELAVSAVLNGGFCDAVFFGIRKNS